MHRQNYTAMQRLPRIPPPEPKSTTRTLRAHGRATETSARALRGGHGCPWGEFVGSTSLGRLTRSPADPLLCTTKKGLQEVTRVGASDAPRTSKLVSQNSSSVGQPPAGESPPSVPGRRVAWRFARSRRRLLKRFGFSTSSAAQAPMATSQFA
mmetsp:Transcript_112521/g.312799  ORF Transcript_112521/g.312799 Transcript_112521/m.312799 type:complete len:153 (+) Transcript_112521:78-536(+)